MRTFSQECLLINGLRISYRHYPSNNKKPNHTIMCLHGLTRNSRDFEDLIPYLPDEASIIVPEQRGRGNSEYDSHSENYHIGQYIEDTWQLLNILKIDQCHIIGTSMGGLMAMIMHDQHAERVSSIVLNDIGPEISREGLTLIAESLNKNILFDTIDAARKALESSAGNCYPNFSKEQWVAFTRQLYVKNAAGNYQRDYDPAISINVNKGLESNEDFSLWPQFLNIASSKKPFLLIQGGLSTLLTKDTVEKMQALAPSMALCTIDDCGHAPTLIEKKCIVELKKHFKSIIY